MKEKLVAVRNFLYKYFLIGFVFYIISVVAYIFLKDWTVDIATTLFNIQPEFYFNLMIVMLSTIKSFLFFFALIPALALHWLIACCKCKKEEE